MKNQPPSHQHTLAESLEFRGVGLHSGKEILLHLRPAEAHSGVVFVRTDLPQSENRIPARWDRVTDTVLCTKLGNTFGHTVGTVEHLMSALLGCHVDNVMVEVSGPELPIMDGSALSFAKAILRVGLRQQEAYRKYLRVLKPVTVEDGARLARLEPQGHFSLSYTYNFYDQGATQISAFSEFDPYLSLIAPARTFGKLEEVSRLHDMGLGLGGSLDNAVILSEGKVLNPEGLRFEDEFARHKVLDAMGDLALAGFPILGKFVGNGSGHAMNNLLLRELFDDLHSWEIHTFTPEACLAAVANFSPEVAGS